MPLRASPFLLILLAATQGCASFDEPLTKDEVDQANGTCNYQIKLDQTANVRTWFSRWVVCKQKRFMPLEIRQHPGKEAGIRAMYDKLIPLARQVDDGLSGVEPVYDEWDRMRTELGINQQICAKHPDGSQMCIPNGPGSVFMETKGGNIVPIR